MIWALILIPATCGILAFLLTSDRLRRTLLVTAALAHFALVLAVWQMTLPFSAASGWMTIDAVSLLFLSICSGLFLAASLYAIGDLKRSPKVPIRDYLEGFQFGNRPEGIFIACLLLFLAAMTAVIVSSHMGILWVAVEATTLASAPLIYYHRHHRSLEAAWRYLLICSVGIALALLGNFFLAVATTAGPDPEYSLLVPELVKNAAKFSPTWLKAAFMLMLVGYGTKMGLAPMHTWLPDAHSESPSLVSALLSGALLNCAFLAILRMQTVLIAAGLGDFGCGLLVLFGLVSMGWAAMLLISLTDYKRMLAYSSVEHMGVLAVGAGLGGVAGAGVMLHVLNHSLAKAALFLVAGNILAVYRSKNVGDARGLFGILPVSGVLWLAGILAITGSPPFGLFTSELMILKGAVAGGRWVVAGGYLAALFVAFAAIIWAGMRMCYGRSDTLPLPPRPGGESVLSVAVPATLVAGVLVLGLWVPLPVWRLINEASATLGGHF